VARLVEIVPAVYPDVPWLAELDKVRKMLAATIDADD
jgi:hypothetical protein